MDIKGIILDHEVTKQKGSRFDFVEDVLKAGRPEPSKDGGLSIAQVVTKNLADRQREKAVTPASWDEFDGQSPGAQLGDLLTALQGMLGMVMDVKPIDYQTVREIVAGFNDRLDKLLPKSIGGDLVGGVYRQYPNMLMKSRGLSTKAIKEITRRA